MDPATSELAQVMTLATSVVGAVVYLQRAQTAALVKLAELFRPSTNAVTVKLDGDQSDRFAAVVSQAMNVRADVRAMDAKVGQLGEHVAALSATVQAVRLPSSSIRPDKKG